MTDHAERPMPRAKAFDPDEVLQQVMELFWEQGYEATSAQDVVDRTGLNRSSLYNTFGCKQDLYLAALDRYCQQGAGMFARLLREEDAAREAVRRVFERAVQTAREGDRRGCFVANAAVERARCDEATRERASAQLAEMREGFRTLVERGQVQGEIPKGKDAEALANFLANTYFGIQTMGQIGPSCEVLGDVVDTALAALD
jgi:TetR/AcrR family transcriptional repressor of nem operon